MTTEPVASPPAPMTLLAVDRRLAQWLGRREFAQALAWLDTVGAAHAQPALPLELRRVRVALAGRLVEPAAAAARRALAAGAGEALHHLALALLARREQRWDDALAALAQGLQQPGTHPDLYLEQGELLLQRGRHAAAAQALEAALNLLPDSLRAASGLASAVAALGDSARAALIVQQMVARAPATADAQFALGNALRGLQQLPLALSAFERASTHDPARPGPWVNRGALLRRLGRSDEALQAYAQAIALDPASAIAYANRANLLRAMERLEEAVQDYDRALAIAPQDAQVHWNKATTLLAAGHLAEGFAEYEWRWQWSGFATRRPGFAQPAWQGEPIAGKTLLVHAEQGAGEVIQFLRFVLALAASLQGQGVRILLQVPAPLRALVAAQAWPGLAAVLGADAPLPPFDRHVAIGSLPLRLGITTLEMLPAQPSLRTATPQQPRDGRLRVGLAWDSGMARDPVHGLRWDQVQPLLDLPGIAWSSLQPPGHGAPPGMPIEPAGSGLTDWHAVAQAMAGLDLVVTPCSATAHLAGALGKPVWVLLAHEARWHWVARQRDGSPWYPSARLFRQERAGEWSGAVAQVREALARRAGQAPVGKQGA